MRTPIESSHWYVIGGLVTLAGLSGAVYCGREEDIQLLLPLLQDVNAEVRGIALQVMGRCAVPK